MPATATHASCVNVIYGIGESGRQLAKLQSGTPDDTTKAESEVHMWTVSKQPWINLAAGVSQFETQPENSIELLQAALDCRATKEQH
jgi:hypothetical protein